MQVRIWSRNHSHAEKFAKDIKPTADSAGMSVVVCSTTQEAVENADIICTVTFATTPVVRKDWVKPGAHINGRTM